MVFMSDAPYNFNRQCRTFLDLVFSYLPQSTSQQNVVGNSNIILENVQGGNIAVNVNVSSNAPSIYSLYDYAVICADNEDYPAIFEMLNQNQNLVPTNHKHVMSGLERQYNGGQYKYDDQYNGRIRSALTSCNLKNTQYLHEHSSVQTQTIQPHNTVTTSVENVNTSIVQRVGGFVDKFTNNISNTRKRISDTMAKTATNESKFKTLDILYSVWNNYNKEFGNWLHELNKTNMDFKAYAPQFSIVTDSDYGQACDAIILAMEYNIMLIERQIEKVKKWLEGRVGKQSSTDDIRILRAFVDKVACKDIEAYDLCKRFLDSADKVKARLVQETLKSKFDEFLTAVSAVFNPYATTGEAVGNFEKLDFLLDLYEAPIIMTYFDFVREYVS